jgi:hypothetical protein
VVGLSILRVQRRLLYISRYRPPKQDLAYPFLASHCALLLFLAAAIPGSEHQPDHGHVFQDAST